MGGTAGEKEGEGEGEGAEGGRGRRPARVDSGSGGRFTRGARGAGTEAKFRRAALFGACLQRCDEALDGLGSPRCWFPALG